MFACGFLHFFVWPFYTISSNVPYGTSRSYSVTLGRTPLDEWSAQRIDLYLTTHNTHNRLTSMTSPEFEPAIPQASDRKLTPKTARPPGSDLYSTPKAVFLHRRY